MLVPIAFFAMIAAIVIIPNYLRYLDRGRMHETLRIAYEKGQPVPPELIEALQSNSIEVRQDSSPERDLRRGMVFLGTGLGFIGLGVGLWYGLMSESETGAWISGGATAGFGAIPGLIGIAYLILWYTRRNTPKA